MTLTGAGATTHASHRTGGSFSPAGGGVDGQQCPATPESCRLDFGLDARGRDMGVLTVWCGHSPLLGGAGRQDSDRVSDRHSSDCGEPERHARDRHMGGILATHGALALFHAQQYDNLQAGLETRDIVGQAKGILMQRYSVGAGQAFELLRRISMADNRPLRELALEVIRTRAMVPADRDSANSLS